MYLQALICSVGLKYYKHVHVQRPQPFAFWSCMFARFSALFVCVCFRQSCAPMTHIASWTLTPDLCWRRMYINTQSKPRPRATAPGDQDMTFDLRRHTADNVNSFCASAPFLSLLPLHPKITLFYPVLNQTVWNPGRLFIHHYYFVIIINYIVISVVLFSFVSLCKC